MANKDQDKISKVVNAWQLYFNPLTRLTTTELKRLADLLRTGNDIRFQIAAYQMEKIAPLFGICIDKRQSGVINRSWDITPIEDSDAARVQAEAVKKVFVKASTRNIDGLVKAFEYLVLGAFRGRAVVKPFITDGELRFVPVENWNTLQWNRKLYWNPDANESLNFINGVPPGLKELSEDEVCWTSYDRPIDLPGLDVYLRLAVGETNWARSIEKFGIPPVLLTPPEGTPDTLLDQWTSRAVAIFEGGSGCLPAGTDVKTLSEARGQDPFSEYIQHQMEMVVMLALGQKMTSLGEAAGLGSNLADVQKSEFESLVTRDCFQIQNAMSRCAVPKVIREVLGESKTLCRFEFVEQQQVKPQEYIDLALKLRDLGATIDIAKLKDLTGLEFIADQVKDLWTPDSAASTKEGE